MKVAWSYSSKAIYGIPTMRRRSLVLQLASVRKVLITIANASRVESNVFGSFTLTCSITLPDLPTNPLNESRVCLASYYPFSTDFGIVSTVCDQRAVESTGPLALAHCPQPSWALRRRRPSTSQIRWTVSILSQNTHGLPSSLPDCVARSLARSRNQIML